MKQVHVYPDGAAQIFTIGRQGEGNVREVVFHIETWGAELGGGFVQLLFRRQEDAAPYPCPLIQDGVTARWAISALETEQVGTGRAELRYVSGAAILKSRTFQAVVLPTLTSGLTPEGAGVAATWLDRLLYAETTAAEAAGRSAAQAAVEAAEDVLEGCVSEAALARDAAQDAARRTAEDTAARMSGYLSEAQAAKTGAEQARDTAQGIMAGMGEALATVSAAQTAAGEAESAALAAQAAAQAAQGSIQTYAEAAASSAAAAALSQGAAEEAAGDAETSAGAAQVAAAAAEQAKTAAQAAAAGPVIPFAAGDWTESADGYVLRVPRSAHGQEDDGFTFSLRQRVAGTYRTGTWAVLSTAVRWDGDSFDILLDAPEEYDGKLIIG